MRNVLGVVSSLALGVFISSPVYAESCLEYEETLRAVSENRPSSWPSDDRSLMYPPEPRRWSKRLSESVPSSVEWQEPNTGTDVSSAERWTTVDFTMVVDPDFSDCSEFLHKTFVINGRTVGFTLARLPETCSEIPKVIWYDEGKTQVGSVRLLPLYNKNTETLWCLSEFTLFGLEASYEGGGESRRLVIWHRPSNRWMTFRPLMTSISELMPEWLTAKVAATRDTIFLRKGSKTITIRPLEGKWGMR